MHTQNKNVNYIVAVSKDFSFSLYLDYSIATEPEINQEQPKRMLPPATVAGNAAVPPKNKRIDTNNSNNNNNKKTAAPHQQKQPKQLSAVQKLLQKQQQQRKKQPQHQQQQLNPKKQQQQQQQQPIPKPPKPQQTSKASSAADEPERFDQRLLVAIPCNWPPTKREPAQRQNGPFAKNSRKLEQMQRLEQKKQKSKQALSNKKLRQQQQQNKEKPIELISLVESEDASDNDDVVIVPLPPVPIIDVDASDDEKEEEQQKPSVEPYIEENAMDAADVKLRVEIPAEIPETTVLQHSALSSPCNSVLSSDDFIVQKDTSRLLADNARATDEDLLVLTEAAIRNAAETSDSQAAEAEKEPAPDTSSEYEFVPPSRLEEIKQNYRVDDEQQFRALDVYESESDLTESGIYCKAKPKATPTIIRNIDSESDSDIEEVVSSNVVKTKRLRKRRASSTNQSQSDPNNEPDNIEDDETDSDDDGVQPTGVPGIARGMAVERCKRKIRRISQRRCSDGAIMPVIRKPVPAPADDASSESAEEENNVVPTARQIAERLLLQKPNEAASVQEPSPDEPMPSEGSDANTDDEAEMKDAMTERISAVFERIDSNTERIKQKGQQQQQEVVNSTEPQQNQDKDNAVAAAEEFDVSMEKREYETNDSVVDLDAEEEPQPSSEQVPMVLVEHNVAELTEPLSGGDLVGWNDEMCRFYNDSWGGEKFNLQKTLKAMSGESKS